MRLILMRHGIAVERSDERSGADAARPLSEQGADRTRRAALGLRKLGVMPDVVLTSPYLRARQTAELVAEGLGLAAKRIVVSEALLPEAEPGVLFTELRDRGDEEVLCAGHAPHLDRALALAIGARRDGAVELKKAGTAAIEVVQWTPVRGRLIWLIEPAALRLLGRQAS